MSTVWTVYDADWLTHFGIDPGDEPFDQEAETVDGYVVDRFGWAEWIDWPRVRIVALLALGVLVLAGVTP